MEDHPYYLKSNRLCVTDRQGKILHELPCERVFLAGTAQSHLTIEGVHVIKYIQPPIHAAGGGLIFSGARGIGSHQTDERIVQDIAFKTNHVVRGARLNLITEPDVLDRIYQCGVLFSCDSGD